MARERNEVNILATKTRRFDGGYVTGVERFEKTVNAFLASRTIEWVLLASYTRTAQGMNLLDYRVLVRHSETPSIRERIQVRFIEEIYYGPPVEERMDRAIEEMENKAPGAQLREVQTSFYEVEAPGRGLGGRDIVVLTVYMLVFVMPLEERA